MRPFHTLSLCEADFSHHLLLQLGCRDASHFRPTLSPAVARFLASLDSSPQPNVDGLLGDDHESTRTQLGDRLCAEGTALSARDAARDRYSAGGSDRVDPWTGVSASVSLPLVLSLKPILRLILSALYSHPGTLNRQSIS